MILKLLIVVAFIVILGALAKAGLSMLRGGAGGAAKKGAMVRALTVRIAVSLVLFACILIAYKFGWASGSSSGRTRRKPCRRRSTAARCCRS